MFDQMAWFFRGDPIKKVFRIRQKSTGKFLTGGHSANAGIYSKESACKGVISGYDLPSDDIEIVTYNLVEDGPTYQEQAARTAPLHRREEIAARLQYDTNAFSLLLRGLAQLVFLAGDLDDVKKHAFYGRSLHTPEIEQRRIAILASTLRDRAIQTQDLYLTDDTLQLLHALLGIITEVGELLEAIVPALLYGEGLDITNLVEEIGDNQWYAALAATTLGVPMETIQARNIAKLRTRFPEKFTEEKANNRNLEAERDVLEG